MNIGFIIQQSKNTLLSFNNIFFIISIFMFFITRRLSGLVYAIDNVWLSLVLLSAFFYWVFELVRSFERIFESVDGLMKHFDKLKKPKLYYGEFKWSKYLNLRIKS